MITYFTTFDNEGNLQRVCSCPEQFKDLQAPVEGEVGLVWQQADPATQWFDHGDKSIKDKAEMVLAVSPGTTVEADGTEVLIVSNIPRHARFELLNEQGVIAEGVVPDGSLELTFDTPGDYTLDFFHYAFLHDGVKIHAT